MIACRVIHAGLLAAAVAHASRAADEKEKAEMSLPPEAKAAIERGLAYLVKTQARDGSWPTEFGRTTGVVGSCVLAFLACGDVPGRGPNGPVVERSVGFLVRSVRADGLVYQEGMPGTPMYHHGIAVVALAECWGMTGGEDERLREVLVRATDLIVRVQNNRGGWRYQPRTTVGDDLSVTVVQMLALRAARDAGIFVPRETIDAGLRYIRSCYDSKSGGFAYQPGGGGGFNMAGAGVLSLQLAGEYQAPEVVAGLKFLLNAFFGQKGEPVTDHFYHYGRYYVAQCVYQAQSSVEWGPQAWNAFYPAMVRELQAKQTATGAWHSLYDEYGTAQSILILAMPNRYLPIYQR